MQAVIFRGPGSVDVGERPDPVIQQPTDAIVRVVLGCVCGSDLVPVPGSGHPDEVLRSLLPCPT